MNNAPILGPSADLDQRTVSRLLEQCSVTGRSALEPLAGGANNRVFRVVTGERTLVLKSYFAHPGDPRDRCGAEWAFATTAWRNGVRCIPEPLASDPENRMSLFEFVPGRKLLSHEVTRERVGEALAFFLALNPREQSAGVELLPAGSEACFRLSDHLHCLRRRVDRLQGIDPVAAIDREAVAFVTQTLRPLCNQTLETTLRTAHNLGLAPDDELCNGDRRVSPSDFGFHNALLGPDGTMKFIDFEYAGWDDPAKTICDFFCQPECPVPMEFWGLFNEEIARHIVDLDRHRRRVELLLPVYRLKWCCILLNEFLPAGSHRRRFAGAGDEVQRKERQLAKVRRAVADAADNFYLRTSGPRFAGVAA
jgi:hypothetical protein